MTLFYAHYPSLEKSFLRFVQRHRATLEPWLVVCASSVIAKRLRAQLAREQGVVANIHFCTASSLLYTLDSEAGPAPAVFPQDHLRDFLLKDILTEPGLNTYPLSRGFIGAVKSALRDLADSLADPDVLEEQLRTFDDENFAQDKERFAWLVQVYKRYLAREASMDGYRPYQALFERALLQVEKSSYLKQFSRIIWYGFYDMPGRPLELVGRLRTHYPLTVFAPYAKVPAYQFATKFFETNWLGAFGAANDENTTDFGALSAAAPYLFAPQGSAGTSGVQVVCAADTGGEVFFAAKEILRLTQNEGYAFSDIGVLVRTQAPYQDEVRRVFAQNKIPLNASFAYPFASHALGAFCLNLLTLQDHNFTREDVLAVLSSPYFCAPQKQNWRKLAEKSLVSLNISQWQDLLPQTAGFDADFLAWLEQCQARLKALDTPGPWAQKCAQVRAFLAENIDENALQGTEAEIYRAVCGCVDSLAAYAAVRTECRAGEFIRELTDALAALTFNQVENVPCGVVFTDVLRARGLRFKAVFILGANEKVFPQILPEDPILRDRYRYILRDVLGYWISQKAERTQEERLLFFTACTAAQTRLYVSYAHRGPDGKEQVPSVYVAELARATQQTWSAQDKPLIGARMTQQAVAVNPLFLTPKEVSCLYVLHGQHTAENFRLSGLATPDTSRQLAAAAAINRPGAVGPFDGCVSDGAEIFEAGQRHGFSPSSLQDLAACPMRYFFRKALHLADPEDVRSRHELAPNTRGQVYHRVLEDFYRELNRQGLTLQLFDSGAAEFLHRALARHYTLQSYRLFGIYPVVWELLLEQIRTQLTAFVREDIQALGGFVPSYFEQEFNGATADGCPFTLRGIIDRIDVNEPKKEFIIADYKSSRKGTRDLAKSFFTHLIFQPFLYTVAAQTLPQLHGKQPAGACLLSIRKGYDRRDLSAPEMAAMRPQAEKFLNLLAQIIRQGTFVLSPSELCAYCPYSAICRKDSFACLMRARKSAAATQLEEARDGNE